MNKPLVSVIIPTYNQSAYIDHTLYALMKQTYSNLEFVISDDCSNDGTYERLCEWDLFLSAKGRVILHQQPYNMGITANYNWLLSHVNGEIIVINEGDDVSLEDRIERLVNYFHTTRAIAIQSNADFLTDHGVYLSDKNRGNIHYDFLYSIDDYRRKKIPYVFDGNAMAFRHELIKRFPEINSHTPWVDDALGKRALLTRKGYMFFEETLVLYRIHGKNTSYEGMGKGKKRLKFLRQNLIDVIYANNCHMINFREFVIILNFIILSMFITILNTTKIYSFFRDNFFRRKVIIL